MYLFFRLFLIQRYLITFITNRENPYKREGFSLFLLKVRKNGATAPLHTVIITCFQDEADVRQHQPATSRSHEEP